MKAINPGIVQAYREACHEVLTERLRRAVRRIFAPGERLDEGARQRITETCNETVADFYEDYPDFAAECVTEIEVLDDGTAKVTWGRR